MNKLLKAAILLSMMGMVLSGCARWQRQQVPDVKQDIVLASGVVRAD